jgi:hypothetical protein
MYVYIYIYTYTCICMYIYIYIHRCTYMFIRTCDRLTVGCRGSTVWGGLRKHVHFIPLLLSP